MLSYYFDLAIRSIKRTPFVSALMIVALAAGVGMTVTMLSVYVQLSHDPAQSLSSKPYALQLQSHPASQGAPYGGALRQMTYMDANAVQSQRNDGSTVAMFKTSLAAISPNREIEPQFVQGRVTTRDFFELFEVELISGNVWSEQVDIEADFVAVITESLARSLYPGQEAVGQSITLNSSEYRVIGVVENFAPQPKYYDLNNSAFDEGESVFVPFSLAPIAQFASSGNTNGWRAEAINTYEDFINSELHWIQVWKAFDSPSQRESFDRWMRGYIDEQREAGRFPNPDGSYFLRTSEEWLEINGVVVDESRILVMISALFLVVCIINTIGLLLGKFLKSAPAIGTRRALGASQWQIFLQHIVEVSIIGFAGGLAGLVMASLVLSGLDGILSSGMGMNQLMLTQLHWSMWLWAPAIAIISSVVAGLLPAWRICRMPPSLYLKIQ